MKLILDPSGVNYTRVMPLYDFKFPDDEKERIKFAENVFNELEQNGKQLLLLNHPRKRFRIGVYQLNDFVYLIQSIKTESFSKNNLYVADASHLDDFKKIAKYLEDIYYGSGKNQIKTR